MILTYHSFFRLLLAALWSMYFASAQQDSGRTRIGEITVRVYFATNANPADAGTRAEEIDQKIAVQLRSSEHLHFAHYRVLGEETQEIFRSYENWSQPLKPSDEILIRFEPNRQSLADSVSLDLELWLARKKILKTDAVLYAKQALYILGPEWRGGRLIIALTPIL
jgi:hypothetical protein